MDLNNFDWINFKDLKCNKIHKFNLNIFNSKSRLGSVKYNKIGHLLLGLYAVFAYLVVY